MTQEPTSKPQLDHLDWNWAGITRHVRKMLLALPQWKGPHLNTPCPRPIGSLPETEGAVSSHGLQRPWVLGSWHLWTSLAKNWHPNLDLWVPTFGLFHLWHGCSHALLWEWKLTRGKVILLGHRPLMHIQKKAWLLSVGRMGCRCLLSLANPGLINLPFPYRTYSISHTMWHPVNPKSWWMTRWQPKEPPTCQM